MDSVIKNYKAVADKDLMLCRDNGVAYQADMSQLVPYDKDYMNKCASYEGMEIARRINAARVALVSCFAMGDVLDVGIGSGEFIRTRGEGTYGTDVNPAAREWLAVEGLLRDDLESFHHFTFWDVLEHIPSPQDYLSRMPFGSFVFASLPIFNSLSSIRSSRHYRPGEHLYYWTHQGFISWARGHGFVCHHSNIAETLAGRDSITSFVMQKVLQ